MNEREITKHYENEEIKVTWKPSACVHFTNCWKELIAVFNPKKRPWVDLSGADAERIAKQIKRCPSGALSYEWKKVVAQTQEDLTLKLGSKVADNKPMVLDLEGGKNHAWCACGHSEGQPWCDGTHQKTDLKPVVFKEEASGTKALCMCKQTKNPPYCDGTHNAL